MKSVNYIILELSSGRITGYGSEQEEFVDAVQVAGELYVKEEFKGYDYYYNLVDGEQVHRPAQICMQDSENVFINTPSTFTGVEEGVEIFIDDVSQGFEDDDGIVEISFDTVGSYKIKFVLFPFLDKEFVVNAT